MPIKVGNILAPLNGITKVVDGNGNVYFQIGGDYYELIEDVTISVATTSVTLNGFTATKEDSLVLVSEIEGNGTYSEYYLYGNNNQTISNYYTQRMWFGDASKNASRDNEPQFSNGDVKQYIKTGIKLTNDGYFTFQANMQRNYPTNLFMFDMYGSSTFIATSITQLDIVASVANAIGIGSRLALYRKVA